MDEPPLPSRVLSSAGDLVAARLIAADHADEVARVGERYAAAITPAMAALIDRADPSDPIARQFIPSALELQHHPAEAADPIGDEAHSPVKGIVHRYPDRVLLKAVAVCPVYCRFCFRREIVGPGKQRSLSAAELAAALDYIRGTPAIWEVIVTGGDPFIFSVRRIGAITSALNRVQHVKVLRWHTRVPIVLPERIDAAFVGALRATRKAVFVAVHANHPRELTPAAREACNRLAEAGLSLVSQTVLLRGVNDDADTLAALFRALVEAHIKPYYLHHGDLAPGTAHFRVPIARGQALMRALRDRLSGLAMPTYVLDVPGGHGKVPIGPSYLAADGDHYTVDLPSGERRSYRDCCAPP